MLGGGWGWGSLVGLSVNRYIRGIWILNAVTEAQQLSDK